MSSPSPGERSGSVDLSRPPSAQHLASLVFLSYRLSQGGIGTQNRMILYVRNNFYPDFMTSGQSDEVEVAARAMVTRYFLNRKLHPATPYTWEGDDPATALRTPEVAHDEVTEVFDRYRNEETPRLFSWQPVDLAASVIVMDADYLERPEGRAGGSEDLQIKVDDYPRDPYDSHFVKYGLLGESTRAFEYNQMFREMASSAVIGQLDQYSRRQLGTILDVYVNNHPALDDDSRQRLEKIKRVCESLTHGK